MSDCVHSPCGFCRHFSSTSLIETFERSSAHLPITSSHGPLRSARSVHPMPCVPVPPNRATRHSRCRTSPLLPQLIAIAGQGFHVDPATGNWPEPARAGLIAKVRAVVKTHCRGDSTSRMPFVGRKRSVILLMNGRLQVRVLSRPPLFSMTSSNKF